MKDSVRTGLVSVSSYLQQAHAIALNSVLAPHQTTLAAFKRAYDSLLELVDRL
jgi:hypothetical protein